MEGRAQPSPALIALLPSKPTENVDGQVSTMRDWRTQKEGSLELGESQPRVQTDLESPTRYRGHLSEVLPVLVQPEPSQHTGRWSTGWEAGEKLPFHLPAKDPTHAAPTPVVAVHEGSDSRYHSILSHLGWLLPPPAHRSTGEEAEAQEGATCPKSKLSLISIAGVLSSDPPSFPTPCGP